jgi:hypothetical protein
MTSENQDIKCITLAEMQIIFNSRIFWRELAIWMRSLINTTYLGLGIADHIFGHLINVPTKFSNMLRLVFGGGVSEQYNQLLTQFVILFRELIAAQSENDEVAMIQIVDRIFENGAARAAFLASINQFWDENHLRGLFNNYIYFTIEQANTFVKGDYDKSVEIFDRLMSHADLVGDYFAYGLFRYITLTQQALRQKSRRIHPTEQCITYERMDLIYDIQLYWIDMATWTRAFLITKAINSVYAEIVYDKLKRVPIPYGNLLKTIYNDETVDELLHLIDTHINLIENLVTAQINTDVEEVNRAIQLLYQNAEERAALIAAANPFIDKNQWRIVLYNYLRSTIDQITSYFAGDHGRDIAIFQRLLDQSERISDISAESLFQYLSYDQSSASVQS